MIGGIPLNDVLLASAALFTIGVAGALLRRSAITIFLSIEVMMNAANLALVGYGAALGVGALASVAEVSRLLLPTDGLWRGVIYGLEPSLIVLIAAGRAPELANANPFYAATPPPLPFVIWSVVWMALVLGAATWWFDRRDL